MPASMIYDVNLPKMSYKLNGQTIKTHNCHNKYYNLILSSRPTLRAVLWARCASVHLSSLLGIFAAAAAASISRATASRSLTLSMPCMMPSPPSSGSARMPVVDNTVKRLLVM